MLFNSFLFGSKMFGDAMTLASVYSTDLAVFESFSLSDGTFMVLTAPIETGPTREIVSGPVPRGDGMYQTAAYFRESTLELRGFVKNTSAALLTAYLDTIKKALRVSEGDLDITDSAGTVKRYIATCDNFEEMFADRERYHLTLCPFKIRFKCLTPFGKARNYTTSSLSITASPTTQTVVNTGTYKAEPVITLVFDAASSVTAVTLQNTTTGEQITYTGSISAADVLVFDSEQKQVTKNGTAVDFTGAFPTLEPNSNAVKITITASSFTAQTTYSYKPTYL